jgi:hypothetical protein
MRGVISEEDDCLGVRWSMGLCDKPAFRALQVRALDRQESRRGSKGGKRAAGLRCSGSKWDAEATSGC